MDDRERERERERGRERGREREGEREREGGSKTRECRHTFVDLTSAGG